MLFHSHFPLPTHPQTLQQLLLHINGHLCAGFGTDVKRKGERRVGVAVVEGTRTATFRCDYRRARAEPSEARQRTPGLISLCDRQAKGAVDTDAAAAAAAAADVSSAAGSAIAADAAAGSVCCRFCLCCCCVLSFTRGRNRRAN